MKFIYANGGPVRYAREHYAVIAAMPDQLISYWYLREHPSTFDIFVYGRLPEKKRE